MRKGTFNPRLNQNLWGHFDKFSLELDVTTRCYSDLLTSDPVPASSRDRFSDAEVNKVWSAYKENTERKDFGNVPAE